MQLGYELLKEQLFFRKEMIERANWFIRLRWIAAGTALFAVGVVHFFLDPGFPLLPTIIILCCILVYNAVFYFVWMQLDRAKTHAVRPFSIFAHTQIAFDILALFILIYFTGGIYSPLLIFVIFHIILTGILLSAVSCFIYAVLVLIAIGGLALNQGVYPLPYQSFLLEGPLFPYGRGSFNLLILYLEYAAAILVTAFLITSIKFSLRSKGRELLRVSKELDESNIKLKALYDMVKGMGLCRDLQALMDLATRNASKIMGVKGCSIKMLDDQRRVLRFASTYGLSENYTAKTEIDIDKSSINRKILEGSLFTIGNIEEKDYFQYPENVRKEGIASMICLPLRVEKIVLGVFCVYSGVSYYFSERDIDFFSLLVDLTALSLENLKMDLNKAWFFQKAAHQLRSPLNAVLGMLTAMRKEYFGSLQSQQKETIARCEKRIEMLRALIGDLLKLGLARADAERKSLHPLDMKEIVAAYVNLYKPQASEKGLHLSFEIAESVPRIMANEELVDELCTNLISNAIKYTSSGGHVRVVLASESHDRVRFEVSDTGIGIPEEAIPSLFSEFYRADNAKALEEEGTGLGLVIVNEILNRLRGTISVKSKVGEGTRFICLLPAL